MQLARLGLQAGFGETPLPEPALWPRHTGTGGPLNFSQIADVGESCLHRLSARSEASGASSDGKEAEPDQAARPTTPPHIMPPLNGLAEGVSRRKVRHDWADSGLKRLPYLAAQAE